jgi:hypothetical protein
MNASYRLAVAALGLAPRLRGWAARGLRPASARAGGALCGVEVVLAPDLALDRGAAARVAAVTRQSALDWLEQRGRLAPTAGRSSR